MYFLTQRRVSDLILWSVRERGERKGLLSERTRVFRSTQTHVYQVLGEALLQVVQKSRLAVVGVQQHHVLDADPVSGGHRSLQVQMAHLIFSFLQSSTMINDSGVDQESNTHIHSIIIMMKNNSALI